MARSSTAAKKTVAFNLTAELQAFTAKKDLFRKEFQEQHDNWDRIKSEAHEKAKQAHAAIDAEFKATLETARLAQNNVIEAAANLNIRLVVTETHTIGINPSIPGFQDREGVQRTLFIYLGENPSLQLNRKEAAAATAKTDGRDSFNSLGGLFTQVRKVQNGKCDDCTPIRYTYFHVNAAKQISLSTAGRLAYAEWMNNK